ncbi:MAG: hypothetical protein MZV65_17120 [Chromatiales bacterium]|nr:hypothetical protein [Chromatiales bacterium]
MGHPTFAVREPVARIRPWHVPGVAHHARRLLRRSGRRFPGNPEESAPSGWSGRRAGRHAGGRDPEGEAQPPAGRVPDLLRPGRPLRRPPLAHAQRPRPGAGATSGRSIWRR